jgi:hypothetical protein
MRDQRTTAGPRVSGLGMQDVLDSAGQLVDRLGELAAQALGARPAGPYGTNEEA